VSQLLRDRELLETARKEAFAYAEDMGAASRGLRAFMEEGGWERRFGLARVG